MWGLSSFKLDKVLGYATAMFLWRGFAERRWWQR
jgi:hypothetical protein